MIAHRICNYPWSGRLGCIAKRCIYCGDDGPSFRLSSAGSYCLGQDCPRLKGTAPIPELLAELKSEYERLAREWCVARGMDYDKVVAELEQQYGGPPDQEREATPMIDPDADDEPFRPVSLILAVVAAASMAYLLLRMFT